jgi:DNA-3-methyladenine glycosylase II
MEEALKHFKNKDKVLYKIAKTIKLPDYNKPEDPFLALVESIISQQLSIKAADTIFMRFKKLFPKEIITPEKLAKLENDKLRECGISYSKINYIKGIAYAILNKQFDFNSLEKLADEEVIEELIKLKGIGVWTAEMYLMFTLGRPDVFSAGDLGLKNAMIKLYNLNKNPKKEELIEISLNWSPYRTTACRILWRIKDSGN